MFDPIYLNEAMGGKTNGQRDVAVQEKGSHLAGMVCKEEDADGPRFDYITEVWSGDVETLTGFAWFAMSEDGKVIFEARATLMDASRTVAGPV